MDFQRCEVNIVIWCSLQDLKMALIPFCGEAAEAGISSGFQLLRQLNSTALRCRYVYAYENVAEHPQDRPEG